MAVEIIGKAEDVRRYREFLHSQGVLTKRFMDAMTSAGRPAVKKPEGFRTFNGGINDVFCIKNLNGVETHVKKLDPEQRLFLKGIANANIIDRMDERLEPAGIDIENYMKNRVLLLDHLYISNAVIGKVTSITAESDGVHFEAFVGDPSRAEMTQQQKDARSLIAQRLLQTVSVGFIPHKVQAPVFDNEGKLQQPAVILAWELLELSVVAVPANAGSVFEVGNLNVTLNDTKRTYAKRSDGLTTSQNDETIIESITESGGKDAVKDNDDIETKLEEERLMEEKILELLDEMKRIGTTMGAVSESLKTVIGQNETIVSSLAAYGEDKPKPPKEDEKPKEDKPKEEMPPEDMPMDDEKPEEDEDKPKKSMSQLRAMIKSQNEKIEKLSTIMLHILEKGEKSGG